MPTTDELDTRLTVVETAITGAVNVNQLPLKAIPEAGDSIEIQEAGGNSKRVSLERLLNHNTMDVALSQTVAQFQIVKLPSATPADKDESGIGEQLIAVALKGGSSGDTIEVLFLGIVKNALWNWNTALPIYLSDDGGLTQTAPTTGTLWVVGKPVDNIRMFFRPKEPVIL